MVNKNIINKIASQHQLPSCFGEDANTGFANTSNGKKIPGENDFLKKINERIEAHLADAGYEVPQLGRELYMSHSKLYRKVKALTGLSVAAYMRSYRLQRGRVLLITTNLKISQVAYRVGFTDPSYFSQMFLEVFGQTPSEVRK